MMYNILPFDRNPEATIYVGNIDQKVSTDVVWELFSQCGVVVNVHLPKDKVLADHQGYGFVEFKSEEDADYSIKIMHMIKLYGKPIKVNKASQDKKTQEVGANLFVGNLDTDVDEKTLYETFQSFGLILSTRITRDPETGVSKGYGFVTYDNFESSDSALNAMNGQYFCNRVIHCQYAYKKDTKGERHGSAAERLLAANRPSLQKQTQHVNPIMQVKPQREQDTLHMPQSLVPQVTMPVSNNPGGINQISYPSFPVMPPNVSSNHQQGHQHPQLPNLPPLPNIQHGNMPQPPNLPPPPNFP